MALGISVLIPTYNGFAILCRHLPSVLEAAEFYRRQTGATTEIIVVDDGSSDETVTALPLAFPTVRLIARRRNGGFSKACNTGFRHCREPLIALINNDVELDREYLLHQAGHFQDANVFAVTAKVFEWEEPVFATGGKVGRFRRGFWSVYFNYDIEGAAGRRAAAGGKLISAYAVGGFSTFERTRLMELGGFNTLLSPFHWEDIDLSYRAWKRGWIIRYEPRSRARHRISATIEAHFSGHQVEVVALRNRLLFHWINLHDPLFLLSHLAMLPILFATRLLVADWVFLRAFWQALHRLGQVGPRRRAERRCARRSDRQVAALLSNFYRRAPIRIYSSRREILQSHRETNTHRVEKDP